MQCSVSLLHLDIFGFIIIKLQMDLVLASELFGAADEYRNDGDHG